MFVVSEMFTGTIFMHVFNKFESTSVMLLFLLSEEFVSMSDMPKRGIQVVFDKIQYCKTFCKIIKNQSRHFTV